jgi:hypothetical protein
MAIIETSIDIDRQLTIHIVKGELSYDEIYQKVMTYNESGPTKFILWDLTDASLSSLQAYQVGSLAQLTRQYSSLRKGGKTVLVVSSDLGFGLGRMFDTHHDILASDIPHMTFKNKELALKWILE